MAAIAPNAAQVARNTGVPVPTPRSSATQLPPSSMPPATKTVAVAAHTRTIPVAKPKASPLAATLPGVDQEAALRAQLAVTPGIQTAQSTAATDAANTAAQAKLISGYYQALGPLLAQAAPGVQAGYQQAAGTDAMLGSAFGGQLNGMDAANNQQAQSILQGQGAPAGQQANAAAATGTPGLGDALGWLNAGLPAQGLTQAGAAYGAAARLLPGQVSQLGGQELAQNAAIGAGQQTTQDQKIAALAARIPGLMETYAPSIAREDASAGAAQSLANYRNNQTAIDQQKVVLAANVAQAKQKLAGQVAAANVAYHNGELSAKDYADRLAAAKLKATQIDDAARIAIEQQNANTSQYRATHPSASSSLKIEEASNGAKYIVNHDGSVTPLPGALGQPKSKVASGSTQRLITNHVQAMAEGSAPRYEHVGVGAPGADANGFVQIPGTGQGQPYQDAINYARGAGQTQAQAVSLANRFYQMGQNGRPYAGKMALTVARQFVAEAVKSGDTKQAALAKGLATGLLPKAALVTAVNQAYLVKVKAPGAFGFQAVG